MCSVFFAIAEFLSIKMQWEKQNGFPETDTRGWVDRFAFLQAPPFRAGSFKISDNLGSDDYNRFFRYR
jgi:hypothetical protein